MAAAKRDLQRQQLHEPEQDLLCDIRDGKLVDMGRDPLGDDSDSDGDARSDFSSSQYATSSVGDSAQVPVSEAKGSAPAAKVLGLAVGLLGLDVHEAPNPWAEAWLSFEDATRKHLGLGGVRHDDEGPLGVKIREELPRRRRYMEEEQEWQGRVLSHLRNLVERGTVRPIVEDDEAAAQPIKADPGKLGPNFTEQLETAEYILKRITSAVICLQDPDKQERPMLLKEYTEKNAAAVCKDLRQWMEQLSNLLSLYHINLLDLEMDRRRLEGQLESQQAKFLKGEEERLSAIHRYAKLDEIRKEEQMKKRAEELLGITLEEDDPKIYSKKDVDEMFEKWKKEKVDPLLAELRDLRAELKNKGAKKPGPGANEEQEVAAASMKMAVVCLKALADRTGQGEVADVQKRMATAISGNPRDLNGILNDINKIEPPQEVVKVMETPKAKPGEDPTIPALAAVSEQLSKLEKGLKDAAPLRSIAGLVGWARDTVEACKGPKNQFKWKPAPGWQISDIMNLMKQDKPPPPKKEPKGTEEEKGGLQECLNTVSNELTRFFRALKNLSGGEKAAAFVEWARDTISAAKTSNDPRWRAAPQWDLNGIGGGSAPVEVNNDDLEAKWQARLDALRAEYEEKLKKLMEELEREKEKTADALRRLAEETKRADDMMNQLRRKLQDMQAIMKKAGLGQAAEDAIWEAGLAEFLNGRDVFERLYRDALSRMRRLAEAQMKMLEESSDNFIRNVQHLYTPFVGQERIEQAVPGQRPGPVFRGPSPAERQAVLKPLYRDGLEMSPGGGRSASPPGLQVAGLGAPGRPPPPGRVIFPAPQSPPPNVRQDEGRYPSPPGARPPNKQEIASAPRSTPDLAIIGGGQGIGHSRSSPEVGPRGAPRVSRGLASPGLGAEAPRGGGGGGHLPPLGGLRGSSAIGGPGGPTTAAAADGCARGSTAARSRSPQMMHEAPLSPSALGLGPGAAAGARGGRRMSNGGSHLLPSSFGLEGFRINSVASGVPGPPQPGPQGGAKAALRAAIGAPSGPPRGSATQFRQINGGTASVPSLGARTLVQG